MTFDIYSVEVGNADKMVSFTLKRKMSVMFYRISRTNFISYYAQFFFTFCSPVLCGRDNLLRQKSRGKKE